MELRGITWQQSPFRMISLVFWEWFIGSPMTSRSLRTNATNKSMVILPPRQVHLQVRGLRQDSRRDGHWYGWGTDLERESGAHSCWKSGAPFARGWNSIQVDFEESWRCERYAVPWCAEKKLLAFSSSFLFANSMGQWCLCMWCICLCVQVLLWRIDPKWLHSLVCIFKFYMFFKPKQCHQSTWRVHI